MVSLRRLKISRRSHALYDRSTYKLDVRVRSRILTTVPDSTSQKFIMVGQVGRADQKPEGRYVVIFLDFAGTRSRKCGESDLEKWYARAATSKDDCLMGHKVSLEIPLVIMLFH